MKPCAACPFLSAAPAGFWSPAHYLLIAYLGSVEAFVEADDIVRSMGCHKFNSVLTPKPGSVPRCGGWIRAARNSFAVQMAQRLGRMSDDEVEESYDDTPVMTPEAMLAQNGFDMTKVPPLRWARGDARYPSALDWEAAVRELREELRADPEAARRYLVPGGPCDREVTDAEVRKVLGELAAARYRARAQARA